jgi:hypothetical protein
MSSLHASYSDDASLDTCDAASSHHSIAHDRAHEIASASFEKASMSPESCERKCCFSAGYA